MVNLAVALVIINIYLCSITNHAIALGSGQSLEFSLSRSMIRAVVSFIKVVPGITVPSDK